MSKMFNTSILVTAILFSALNCVCWVQLISEPCHISEAMPSCCCGDQPEVTAAEQDLPPALLSSLVEIHPPAQTSEMSTSPVPVCLTSHLASSERVGSRASPHLYILNTSFLI